jgi:spermidine synthase
MALRGRLRGGGQGIEVSERDGVRYLHIGSTDIQSAMRVDRPYDLELTYSRCVFAPLLFAPMPRRVFTIGLGGGSIPKFIHHHMPEVVQTVVEIDPRVVAVARTQFMLPPEDERLTLWIGDGAEALRRETVPQDWILLDGFDGSEQSDGLTTEDFYAECARRLTPTGVLIANIWSTASTYDAQIDRLRRIFPERLLLLPAGFKSNVLCLGFAAPPRPLDWAALRLAARQWQGALGLPFDQFLDDLKRLNAHDSRHLQPGG